VVVADREDEGARRLAADIGGDAVAFDVTEPAGVRVAIGHADEAFGPIDVLVNNAGGDRPSFFVNTDESTWEAVLALNLTGVSACTHAVLGSMVGGRARSSRGGATATAVPDPAVFRALERPTFASRSLLCRADAENGDGAMLGTAERHRGKALVGEPSRGGGEQPVALGTSQVLDREVTLSRGEADTLLLIVSPSSRRTPGAELAKDGPTRLFEDGLRRRAQQTRCRGGSVCGSQ
jgi:hypothetical protein